MALCDHHLKHCHTDIDFVGSCDPLTGTCRMSSMESFVPFCCAINRFSSPAIYRGSQLVRTRGYHSIPSRPYYFGSAGYVDTSKGDIRCIAKRRVPIIAVIQIRPRPVLVAWLLPQCDYAALVSAPLGPFDGKSSITLACKRCTSWWFTDR